VCSCCQDIERPAGACPGGRESNLRRPLLPPHWPKHARAAGASSDHLTVSIWRGTPPNHLPWSSSLPPLALREPGSDEMPADRRRVRLFVDEAAANEQPGDVLVPGAGAAPFRGRLESAAAERVCPPPHHRTSVGVWSAQQ
jgi:hypothetical protein